jgi:6,7-dimethyl-8-ribityllumazine synthase
VSEQRFPERWPDRSSENVLAPEPALEPGPEPAAAPGPPQPEPVPEPAELEPVAEPAEEKEVEEAEEGEEAEDGEEPDEQEPGRAEAAEEEEQPAPEEHAAGPFALPEGVAVLEGEAGPTRQLVAIAVGKFNGEITSQLLESALGELDRLGVARSQLTIVPVPGAFELPLAAMALAKTRRYLCVVALGCVIRGETPHFEYVASEAASGLQLAGLETGIPVAFGVLTCETREQAEARVGKGAEAVRTALEMADLFSQLRNNVVAQA